MGWIKVNSDASVDKKRGWLGYGAVARDERGVVMAAQCRTIKGNLDVTLAEAGGDADGYPIMQKAGFSYSAL